MSNSLETVLRVENIRVKAYHGWYASERKVGGMYTVNIEVTDSTLQTEDFKEMETSINYENIYDIVISKMKLEFKLIEECCKSIFDELKKIRPGAIWMVHLTKENPPLKFVGATTFTIKG